MSELSLALQEAIQLLNPSQGQAVQEKERHVLVSAGAGTGKTRVLTLRYAYLVENFHINPNGIMAVTFTNKASQEMRHRLKDMFSVYQLWIGTFHSLGLRMLKQHPHHIGRHPDFGVLDVGDQLSLIQKLLKQHPSNKAYTPRMVAGAISEFKHKLWLPEEVLHSKSPFYLDMYRAYQEQLLLMNCVDFDDLLMLSLRLMQGNPDIVQAMNFKHVLVDEYQDINEMQYLWLKVFADHGACLFCVGDDDQSIYGWRGASIDKILRFPVDFPDSSVVCLEDNYRSTPHILSAASHLIANNQDRYGKVLRTEKTVGEKIHVQGLWDSGEEAAFIADQILHYTRKGEALSSMAILVRTSSQTREFEERFTLQHIPYHLVGSTRFYDRMEIRDVVAYLRVLHSRTDNLAFERIINVPKRGIGPVTLQTLYAMLGPDQPSLEQAARDYVQQEGEKAVKKSLLSFLEPLTQWRQRAGEMKPAEMAEMVIQESGYMAHWQIQGIQGQARLDNIKELIKAMYAFSSLGEFLEHVSLLADVSDHNEHDSIAVMTMHAAKGLEFDTVFLPGWEEHIFPHIRSIEESGKRGVEEERRLAYVGITRARKKSHISFCWNRRGHQGFMPSSPSRFISELPGEDIIMTMKAKHHGLDTPSLKEQKRVMHAVFGQGVLQNQSGDMASVLFDRHGLKKVLSRFLNFLS